MRRPRKMIWWCCARPIRSEVASFQILAMEGVTAVAAAETETAAAAVAERGATVEVSI